jgi:hypothetical protein
MSNYLQRMASSALSPGGSIRPILRSIFSPSTSRRVPEHIPGKGSASSLIAAERVVPTPAGPDSFLEPGLSGVFGDPVPEATTFFNPLVNEGQRSNVESRLSSIDIRNGDARSDEQPSLAAQNNHENVTPGRHAPGRQGAGMQPPLPAVTPISRNAKQSENTEPISEPVDTLAARAKKSDLEDSEAPDNIRYRPLMTASGSSADGPVASWKVSSPLTPATRKEAKGNLSSSSGLPEREPDEIQIHIGRIEVTAVPQAVPRPAPPPLRKSISLNDYLKRGEGRSG